MSTVALANSVCSTNRLYYGSGNTAICGVHTLQQVLHNSRPEVSAKYVPSKAAGSKVSSCIYAACLLLQEQIRVLTQRRVELTAAEEAAKASPEEQREVLGDWDSF